MNRLSVECEAGVPLSPIELEGFREYETAQQDQKVLPEQTPEEIVKTIRIKFIERPGSGELTRKPHRHVSAQEEVFEGRKKARRSLQKCPTWMLRAPSLSEDFDGHFDPAENLPVEAQKPDRAWLWDANSLRAVYLPLDLSLKIL